MAYLDRRINRELEIPSANAGEIEVVNTYLTSRSKRYIDISFAIIGLIAVAISLPFVAVLLISSSGLPVFYRRARLGLYGREFSMVKYRTMEKNDKTPENALRTAKNDPRISRIGSILRKSYVDELPQFWNVLKGDMSAVGPRPEFPELAIQLSRIRSEFPRRLLAKPGITGLAQIRYQYSHDNAHAAGRLPFDLTYIKQASFKVDLWIISRTLAKSFKFGGT